MEGVCSSNAAMQHAGRTGQDRTGQGREPQGRRVRERNTRFSKHAQAGIATQGRAAPRKVQRILKQSSRKEN